MARRQRHLKESAKVEVEKLQRKCRYCKSHQSARGFDKHEAWCKKISIIRQELQEWNAHSTTRTNLQNEATRTRPPSSSELTGNSNGDFVEGSSMMPMEPAEYPLSDTQQEPAMAPSHPSTLTLFLKYPFPIFISCRPYTHLRASFTPRIHQNYPSPPLS